MTPEIDDDELAAAMEDFFIEHDREPYGADEFTRWFMHRVKLQVDQITYTDDQDYYHFVFDSNGVGRLVSKKSTDGETT